MNRFTLIIHNKGWTVTDACDHWAIRYATYNARCNNPKMFNQLECMCNGLESKLEARAKEVATLTYKSMMFGEGMGETFIEGKLK